MSAAARTALRSFALVLVLGALGGGLAACSSDGRDDTAAEREPASTTTAADVGPATTEPLLGQPAPTFEALSDAFTYGDDPALDELWDACAAGSGKACDDLYFAAPTDSEYETFGYTCGNRPNLIICTELDEEPGLTPTTG
jgi:hypothetical protein